LNATNYLLSYAVVPEDSKLAVKEFRRIPRERSSEASALEALRKTRQLESILAGFWQFLVDEDLVKPSGP